MKKAVRNSVKGASSAPAQSVPVGTVKTVATTQPIVAQVSASPRPAWSRYVDSRLKQFCMR